VSKPDHGIADRLRCAARAASKDLRHRRAVVVVHDRLGTAAERLAVVVADALAAVQRGAVRQQAEPAVIGSEILSTPKKLRTLRRRRLET
jgi:hypothetical protein